MQSNHFEKNRLLQKLFFFFKNTKIYNSILILLKKSNTAKKQCSIIHISIILFIKLIEIQCTRVYVKRNIM